MEYAKSATRKRIEVRYVIFENELELTRLAKADELRSLGVNPYPHFLKRDMSISEVKTKFAYIKDLNGDEKADEEVTISGRLKLKRVAGKSTFANMEDENDNIQIYYSLGSIGEEDYTKFKKIWKSEI